MRNYLFFITIEVDSISCFNCTIIGFMCDKQISRHCIRII